jgi:hypothetical protein
MDPFLEIELKKQDLSQLYRLFCDHGIIVQTLWTLNEQDLLEMGCSIGERKLYTTKKEEAIKKEKSHENGNSEFLITNNIRIKLYVHNKK